MQNRSGEHPRGVALTCRISQSLAEALAAHQESTGESMDHVVRTALADYLQVEHGTLFQVSTAGALVEGLSRGEVTIGVLREHGDFGLGTFDRLDGEMVALDGAFYRVAGDGCVIEADDAVLTPYAMVTHFTPERSVHLGGCVDLSDLCAKLDGLRRSENHFYAIRTNGTFDVVRARSVSRTRGAVRLADAAAAQHEFTLENVAGTVVGFWSPAYVTALTVPGYHLHFLTSDRTAGGHLLDCRGGGLHAWIQHEADFRLSLPESPSFLQADLTRDPAADLNRAEKAR